MYILYGISIALGIYGVLLVTSATSKKWIIIGVILVILSFGLLIGVMSYQENIASEGSTSVATIGGKTIYYNESSDKYFILVYNEWDLFNIFNIEYLDNKDAKELINAAKIVDSWK